MEVVIDGIEYVPKEQKEEPRQIDWNKVASHVPVRGYMEEYERECTAATGVTGFLEEYDDESKMFLVSGRWKSAAHLRTGLWVPHISDECPLPEGVMVTFVQRNGRERTEPTTTNRCFWGHTNEEYDIIRFRVMGLAEGWRW